MLKIIQISCHFKIIFSWACHKVICCRLHILMGRSFCRIQCYYHLVFQLYSQLKMCKLSCLFYSWSLEILYKSMNIYFILIDEREIVQKKTFQKWVNSHLIRVNCKISDLYVDLRDGKMLIKLLEVLSGERLVCLFDTVIFHQKLSQQIIVR